MRSARDWEKEARMRWAAHVYLGEGIQEWDLLNQPQCGESLSAEELLAAEGVEKERGEAMGERMLARRARREGARLCRGLSVAVRGEGSLEV